MERKELYEQELEKLRKLFKDVEPAQAALAEGLIEEAAFLKAENMALKVRGLENGMIKAHPEYPEIQKPVESARQYLRNVNTYSTVIKVLGSILQKSSVEEDDAFAKFLKRIHGYDD